MIFSIDSIKIEGKENRDEEDKEIRRCLQRGEREENRERE